MIKIENVVAPSTEQWEAIIRGCRNPMNSWNKSDSYYPEEYRYGDLPSDAVDIGDNDLNLMKRLCSAGTDHRKFMRMIPVYLDIIAPLYFWKEFSTYKVGTVANSCSTMHKILDKEFKMDDFSCEHLYTTKADIMREFDEFIAPENKQHNSPYRALSDIIEELNQWRDFYIYYKNKPTKDIERHNENLKRIWWQMIQLLPSSYNQRRTVMLNYEVLANIYKSRKGHRLDEWRTFCDWIEGLPYSELITGKEKNDESI